MQKKIKLGVNIDHIATLRNARNENFPDITAVAKILHKVKVDSITVPVSYTHLTLPTK